MQPNISLVTLGVRDLARGRAFYVDGLGFPEHETESDAVVFLKLDGAWLALFGWDDLAGDAKQAPESSGFRGVTLAHNVATRDAVDAILAQAAAAGGTIVKPGQEPPWGGYSGYFADPDGHLWEVAYPTLAEAVGA